jgi:hypothetical protein
MKPTDLVMVRKRAEGAVAEMDDGPLKIKAFEVILQSLLISPRPQEDNRSPAKPPESASNENLSSVADRINLLAVESFFAEPRSLAEIQAALAEHGWHYPQGNLSTPLVRLVRQRRLRRLQLAEGNKRVWKYSLP